MLKPFNVLTSTVRNLYRQRPYRWDNEGIQYPGFKYFPRHEDFKDPPYEPTKLFRVQRIRTMKGLPYWEKNILKEFKLDGKQSDIAIIKNIPENNHRLWKIKHAIKIVPITFPDGFPSDSVGTYLKENGELKVAQTLRPSTKRLEASENFETNPVKLDGNDLRRDSRKKWLSAW